MNFIPCPFFYLKFCKSHTQFVHPNSNKHVFIKGQNYVGAFGVGNIFAENCFLTSTSYAKPSSVYGINYVGGIVATNNNGYTLKNTSTDMYSQVNGVKYVGGIEGCHRIDGHIGACKIFDGLENKANVTAQNNYVGGILGGFSLIASGSYNDINYCIQIRNCKNKGNVTGQDYVGGIIGDFFSQFNNNEYIYAALDPQLSDIFLNLCLNEGIISGSNYVGGISGGCGVAANMCYNTGDINASNEYAGGIFGYLNGQYCNPTRLWNSYSLGNVTA